MKKIQNLKFYKNKLPQNLTAYIYKTKEGGFWTKIKELPHCYSQAENFLELIEMINDAIFTYFDIPVKFRKKIGYYVPERILKKVKPEDEIKRKEWERCLQDLMRKAKVTEKREVLAIV